MSRRPQASDWHHGPVRATSPGLSRGEMSCPRGGLEHGNRCDLPGSGKSCNKSNKSRVGALGYPAACSLFRPPPGLYMAGTASAGRGRCERWRRSCPLSESREHPLARSAGLPGTFLAGYASAEAMAQLRQLGVGRHNPPHAPGVVGAVAAGGGAGGGRSWLHRAGFGAPGRPCEQVRPAGRPGHGIAAGRWLQIPGGRPA